MKTYMYNDCIEPTPSATPEMCIFLFARLMYYVGVAGRSFVFVNFSNEMSDSLQTNVRALAGAIFVFTGGK